MNVKKLMMLLLLILLIPSFAAANEIVLPQKVEAQATVFKKSTRDGLWEKTLIVRFPQIRRVLSSNDGVLNTTAVANHSAHPQLWNCSAETMKSNHKIAAKVYMQDIRGEIAHNCGLRTEEITMMGTSADMDNLAVVTKEHHPFVVTAIVTAGAKGNAVRTGVDEGLYVEPDPASDTPAISKEPKPGTINIILLTNTRITDGGMVRAVITATEAKTAALEDLHVPSSFTKNVQATGTGTDSIIIVSGTSGPLVTYPGGHSLIGGLMGKAVYEAVVEALGKQNGFKKNKTSGKVKQ
ncbi:MAG: adenosylcobinamide amidohydrolase [Smithella sp.]